MHPGEDATLQPSGQAVVVDVGGLSVLFDALRGRGFTVVGPTVRDDAIQGIVPDWRACTT